MQRRGLLIASLCSTGLATPQAWARTPEDTLANAQAHALLRRGGVVLAFRHALAPGTFDPPAFTLGDCRTQRNLSDEGRAQARRIGEGLRAQGLRPARVRSSPWCRCLDTARLAFADAVAVETWPALGSPHGRAESTNDQALAELRRALSEATRQPGRFEVWVTHMFVLSALASTGSASGEGLVLQADTQGAPRVIGRIVAA